jgi:outer membrane protein
MLNTRNLLLAALLAAVLGVSPVIGETITRVAVVDMSRIFTHYFRESQAVRELERMNQRVEDEVEAIREEIRQLEERKIEAENDGDEREALRLDNEIFRKKEYLREYVRVKGNQLRQMRENLASNSSFYQEVVAEIQFVAENEGYSLVIRSDGHSELLWWTQEVDITELVLQRLAN